MQPAQWAFDHGSSQLLTAVLATFVVGFAVFFGLTFVPPKFRRPIVIGATFLAGLFYVLFWLVPKPIAREAGQLPNNGMEAFAFWLEDFQPEFAMGTNVIAALLLGLGVYSVLKVHITRLAKKQKNWEFSLVLLAAMVAMCGFAYADWIMRDFRDPQGLLAVEANWTWVQYTQDLLFDGFLQQMDAAMFSMIAFFILSAAYRAFRIRSVEATVLMASALILLLSLIGAIDFLWSQGVDAITGQDPTSFWNNIRISVIAGWFRETLQVPSIRAMEFGVGLGALAMGLRLWLGLEKGGVN
ncbi:MAG: hypothetical protein MH204_05540 [Fimbriimonadaceae bacterium]|nr:hypothetical protein [Fimbriimonadaceae bacterium]